MMKSYLQAKVILALAIVLAAASSGVAQLGGEFTFQGNLEDNGQPADGTFDVDFSLWSAANGGSEIGAPNSFPNLVVDDGLFTVELDFGTNAFDSPRWLEIEVDGVILSPRQSITGAPYSIQTRGLFVNADNDVGIGTTAPIADLHVRGDGSGTVMRLSNGNSPQSNTALIAGDVSGAGRAATFFGITTADLFTCENSGAGRAARFVGDVQFSGGDVTMGNLDFGGELTSFGDRFFVGNDGYVGIGRSVPIDVNSQFDVESPAGNNQFGGMFVNTAGSEGLPFYAYATNGTLRCFTHFNGGVNNWQLRIGGQTPILVDGNNSRVGLSTFTPQFLLHVNGTAGKPGGGSWSVASDQRLKKNIRDLDGALENLMKLRGVTYEYIDAKSIDELEGVRTGVIAQEVEKVFPDWVEEKEDGYKSVVFRGFEALAIEALRELRSEKNQEIELLQAENRELQDRLAALEAAVENLVSKSATD